MSDKSQFADYEIMLDGRRLEVVRGWDTAVSRAVSILSGAYGRLIEVVNVQTGVVAWRWDVAWNDPHTAVQFEPGVGFVSEPTQFDASQTVHIAWLFLLVSLSVNIALLWGIYYLIF